MNQKLINTLMFTTGAAIGSLVTWRLLKSRYERYVQEEIDKFVTDWKSRVQYPNTRDEENDDNWNDFEHDEIDEDDSNETEIYDYHQLARKYGGEGVGEIDFPQVNGPVVITPDEFGDGNYGHSLIALSYYSDGVLANDWLEVFDIEKTIGEEALEHFGDYTDDVVHVRNEQKLADYEVTKDPRTFAEVSADDALMATYVT